MNEMYRALLKIAMDHLKDGRMMIDWAKDYKSECPSVAKWLIDCAEKRINSDYDSTIKFIEELMEKDEHVGEQFDVLMDELDEWNDELRIKLKKIQ